MARASSSLGPPPPLPPRFPLSRPEPAWPTLEHIRRRAVPQGLVARPRGAGRSGRALSLALRERDSPGRPPHYARRPRDLRRRPRGGSRRRRPAAAGAAAPPPDRKSTRLNSSHVEISYAVFCLKKKKTI